MPKGRPVSALAIEMNRQNRLDLRALRRVEYGFHFDRIEVEGGRLNVGEKRLSSGAQDRADRGEEAERRRNDRLFF